MAETVETGLTARTVKTAKMARMVLMVRMVEMAKKATKATLVRRVPLGQLEPRELQVQLVLQERLAEMLLFLQLIALSLARLD